MLPDYQAKIAGAEEKSVNVGVSITAQVPLYIFIIFTLLMPQLHNSLRSVVVLPTGLLGLVGAAATLLLLCALMGFVVQLDITALIGMIIHDSVILVNQIEQDMAAGVPTWNVIIEAAVRRFRPIVLTVAVTVLAMIPLSRSVFWNSMAAAIMDGLITTTILTLLSLSMLYMAWFRIERPDTQAVAPTVWCLHPDSQYGKEGVEPLCYVRSGRRWKPPNDCDTIAGFLSDASVQGRRDPSGEGGEIGRRARFKS